MPDYHSFLFSVDKKAKYPIVKDYGNAIYCNSSYGPTFGNGHHIHVADNSDKNTSSHVRSNSAYNVPNAEGKSYPVLTDGNEYFKTVEIEVYQII